ncbi:hypothetical protein [Thiolapillus brandeum]|uniref:MotA/TolQ/ExbB proton channel domain-containing protein n=1 Tax=Thiolapillus brandeum TaxID=1076588 RepID=A0A7U6JHP4_9GAMM|nr:hypothetical protein [Thiolapillus brandeum]BAO44541.1 conserved hypothetical protein [Thiolapillus brandeum]
MQIISFRRHFSRNTLLLMFLVALVMAGIAAWKYDLVATVYFRDQLTATGWIINGAIVALFLLGLMRMIAIFHSYSREEKATTRFIRNQEESLEDPLYQVPANSIIAARYRVMERLHATSTPINQGALAATLLASESTRTSFPKYISNVLILTGVFGTIVSLSLALLGASDLLENAVDVEGMGLVIHGMSTALSTTITAIVCYLFFGYFYLKLTDAQTNLLSAVEQVTTTYLAPLFVVEQDTTLYEFTGLVRSLQSLVRQMQESQKVVARAETRLLDAVDEYQSRVEQDQVEMGTVVKLLRQGFRLPEDHE